MPKFYGGIGFVKTVETPEGSGIWKKDIQTREYAGEINRFSRRWDTASKVNEDISINYQVSVIADPFLMENLGYIRFVEWNGFKWKVTTVTPSYPRLTLEIGEVFNG